MTFKAAHPAFTFNVTVNNEEFDFDILRKTQPCVLTFLYIVQNIKGESLYKKRGKAFFKVTLWRPFVFLDPCAKSEKC